MGSIVRGVGRSSGFSIRMVLSGVLALSILIGLTVYHANFVAGRSLMLAFPDWEVTYRSAWPQIGGGVVAKDITLIPPEGESEGTMRFSTLTIDVPFFQYYVSGFSRRRGALLNAIHNLRLELKGGHGTLNDTFTSELAAFGNFTGAPFEAEGCVNDSVWLEKEVGEMGLNPRGVDLSIAFDSEGPNLIKRQSLSVPGVGRVDLRRDMIKHDNFSLFSLVETGLSEVAADEWHVKDEGFVAARNAHCALTDKVSQDEFVSRHMQSVMRLLEVAGIAVSPEIADAYQTYATKGGGFDLTVRYEPPLSLLKDASKEMEELLPRVQAKFAVAGKVHAVALRSIPARPLPETEESLTTFGVVQREANRAPAKSAAAEDTEIKVVVNAPAPAKPVSAPVAEAPPIVPDLDADGAITKFADLSNYFGKTLTVHMQGRSPMRVELLHAAEGGILVRRHLAGGNVEYIVDRGHFEYAKE